MHLICRVGFTTSQLSATGHKHMSPLCGECSSPISGQWAPSSSRGDLHEAPRPAVKSACYTIPVVRSCYAVWSTSPRPPVHWQTADHGNGMVEEARSSADATAQATSASPPSANQLKLAPPGTDDSSVTNALGPLLNAGTSHLPSSTVAAPAAKPAVDWWHENEQRFPSAACVAVTTMF